MNTRIVATAATTLALFVPVAAGCGTESDKDGRTPAETKSSAEAPPTVAPAPLPPPVAPVRQSAREKLEEALADQEPSALGAKDAEITGISAERVVITAKTPEGGFEGASTGDLNRAAADVFQDIYGDANYTRATDIAFRGGLVNTKTGRDLPDEKTGQFEMSKSDAAAIDWGDEDGLLSIDWANFRVFAHPTLKQDE